MELVLIILILIDLIVTSWYFSNRLDTCERKAKHLENSIQIMNRRLKELDGIELAEIENNETHQSITILLDPEGRAPEIRIDDED